MAKEEPKDPRSTGRKRGRKVLQEVGRPYWCGSTDDGDVNEEWFGLTRVGCGRSPSDPEAPGGMYPNMGELQVNHINKNVLDNDPINLEWLCAGCHKNKDKQTGKGESIRGDEFGYKPSYTISDEGKYYED